MPMDRTRYPDDWDAIALAIKAEQGDEEGADVEYAAEEAS